MDALNEKARSPLQRGPGRVCHQADADDSLNVTQTHPQRQHHETADKDAEQSLCEKVERFGAEYGVSVEFHSLGLTFDQVEDMGLPTRPAKSKSAADRRWPYPYAAELDAIPPDTLRDMVRNAIERHLPAHELEQLKHVEAQERNLIRQFVREVR